MQGRHHGKAPFRAAVLHGGPGGAGEIADLCAVLARRGLSVVEPYQTGLTLAAQVDELHEVLKTRRLRQIIGWSWGAWLGCAVAAKHPDVVDHLILVSCPPFTEAAAQRTRARRQARQAGVAPANPSQMALAEIIAPIKDATMPPVFHDAAIHRSVWAEASAMRARGEWLSLLGTLRCKVTAIHGADDLRPAGDVQRALARHQPAADVQVLEHCGHYPWRESAARDPFLDLLCRAVGNDEPPSS